ncbi:aureocin A53 family class IId bacteriocin [Agrococcus sp. Ld7]|uniref:aureocin A53 family class IId bacteriocin n=1 Tax=Agrococcus sp. Ld7 TaxID=649148 RepID=UPI003870E640
MGAAWKFAKFVAWLGKQAWKYGKKVPAMVRWAWSHRSTVMRWLERGLTFYTIAELIYRAIFG